VPIDEGLRLSDPVLVHLDMRHFHYLLRRRT
jgi:hypothetical protein